MRQKAPKVVFNKIRSVTDPGCGHKPNVDPSILSHFRLAVYIYVYIYIILLNVLFYCHMAYLVCKKKIKNRSVSDLFFLYVVLDKLVFIQLQSFLDQNHIFEKMSVCLGMESMI